MLILFFNSCAPTSQSQTKTTLAAEKPLQVGESCRVLHWAGEYFGEFTIKQKLPTVQTKDQVNQKVFIGEFNIFYQKDSSGKPNVIEKLKIIQENQSIVMQGDILSGSPSYLPDNFYLQFLPGNLLAGYVEDPSGRREVFACERHFPKEK